MEPTVTCLVTIHGIGFQQPPVMGAAGYADALHQRLSHYLDATILGDDPQRERSQPGENGPIYVQSSWPPQANASEPGLARLGTWRPLPARTIETSQAPLTAGAERIAHVALVYSHLEERSAKVGSALEATASGALALGHYATIAGLAHMLVTDVSALWQHRASGSPVVKPGLRVRDDPGFHAVQSPGYHEDPSGLLPTIRQLENDVAAYVCRNDLRERVRGFVREALVRLAYRDDVAAIVVNSHSNGTTIAYDVLRQLPPFATAKVRAFITAGSPLRKYVDLFYWGSEIGCIYNVGHWLNFWDPRDPVADPLALPADWRVSDPVDMADRPGLFRAVEADTGRDIPFALKDYRVDNLAGSQAGGLQAHNYWDNERDFVAPLAALLRETVATPAATASGAGP